MAKKTPQPNKALEYTKIVLGIIAALSSVVFLGYFGYAIYWLLGTLYGNNMFLTMSVVGSAVSVVAIQVINFFQKWRKR